MIPRMLALVAVVVVALSIAAVPALAQDDSPDSDEPPVSVEPEQVVPSNDIIVRPNSGVAPDDPGDRGGWQQLLVLGLLVATIGFIAIRVVSGARAGQASGDDVSSAGGRRPAG